MHKLTVKLKQHTPLIHFQHDQSGATLRASEVKPKLDRFIIKECFNNDFEKCRQYLVGYDSNKPNELLEKFNDSEQPYRALNYKMRIVVENNSLDIYDIGSQYPSRNNSILQINIGKEPREQVKMSFAKEGLIIVFTSIAFDITEIITKDRINNFFFYNCFGNRVSKGFGSFTVESYNGISVEYPKDNWYCAQFDIESNNRGVLNIKSVCKTLFAVIHRRWKDIKRSANCRGNRVTNVLLNVAINGELGKTYERVPSPIVFKPILYEDDYCCGIDVLIGLNHSVINEVYGSNAEKAKEKFRSKLDKICKKYPDDQIENNYVSNYNIVK